MNLSSHRHPGRRAAFTLVEIAICLAIIVFALVAIIGVLPIGMNVQKDNREETIIGQEASYFMNALRRGDRGLDDLTNYLVAITNYETKFDVDGVYISGPRIFGYTISNSTMASGGPPSPLPSLFYLTNGACIMGILGTPKYVPTFVPGTNIVDGFYSNHVFADFRALNGPVGDKAPQRDENIRDLAFAYRLYCEITPAPAIETNSLVARTLRTNLHELRLQFRWPLRAVGVGNNRQVFRTQLAASLTEMNNPPLYYLNPDSLVFVPPK